VTQNSGPGGREKLTELEPKNNVEKKKEKNAVSWRLGGRNQFLEKRMIEPGSVSPYNRVNSRGKWAESSEGKGIGAVTARRKGGTRNKNEMW